jgi:hypothetical protein
VAAATIPGLVAILTPNHLLLKASPADTEQLMAEIHAFLESNDIPNIIAVFNNAIVPPFVPTLNTQRLGLLLDFLNNIRQIHSLHGVIINPANVNWLLGFIRWRNFFTANHFINNSLYHFSQFIITLNRIVVFLQNPANGNVLIPMRNLTLSVAEGIRHRLRQQNAIPNAIFPTRSPTFAQAVFFFQQLRVGGNFNLSSPFAHQQVLCNFRANGFPLNGLNLEVWAAALVPPFNLG